MSDLNPFFTGGVLTASGFILDFLARIPWWANLLIGVVTTFVVLSRARRRKNVKSLLAMQNQIWLFQLIFLTLMAISIYTDRQFTVSKMLLSPFEITVFTVSLVSGWYLISFMDSIAKKSPYTDIQLLLKP